MDPGPSGRVVVLDGDVEVLAAPLAGAPVDLALVDRLARLRMAAVRLGLRFRLEDPGPDLVGLVRLVGLNGVLLGEDAGERPCGAPRRPPDPACERPAS